jgi:hypothetical protein
LLIGRAGARRTYVWGAGALGLEFARRAGPRFTHVAAFLDRDPVKQTASVAGKPVLRPEILPITADTSIRPYVIVTSRFADEIVPVLADWGYSIPDDAFVFPGAG